MMIIIMQGLLITTITTALLGYLLAQPGVTVLALFPGLAFLGLGWMLRQRDPGLASNPLGDARFATAEEVRAACTNGVRGAEVVLGHLDGELMTCRTEKHVLLMVSAGGGKGVSYILPDLLSYQGSVFVTDPKGENAIKTAAYRATLGDIKVIDPWEIATGEAARYRTRFNPLEAFLNYEDQVWARAKSLAASFAVVQKNDHWQNRANQLLTALIAHVCTYPDLEALHPGLNARRDLVTVRRLLMENFAPSPAPAPTPAKTTRTRRTSARAAPEEPAAPISTLEALVQNTACNGAIAREALGLLRGAQDEVASILSTAQTASEFIEEPHIADCLRDPYEDRIDREACEALYPNPWGGVDFSKWRDGVLSVYLCVPAPVILSYPNWPRLIITAAIDTMTAREEPPPRPVQFILDELGFLGRLQAVAGAFGLARSFGVQIWSVFQDIGMIRRDYGPELATIWNNAGVRIAFAAHDFDTASYISKQCGTTTVRVEGSSESRSQSGESYSSSIGQQARPLLHPHEVSANYAASAGRALVFLDGLQVAELGRVIAHRDAPFSDRATFDSSSAP